MKKILTLILATLAICFTLQAQDARQRQQLGREALELRLAQILVQRRHRRQEGKGVDQQSDAPRDEGDQRGVDLFALHCFACERYRDQRDDDADHGDDQSASEIGKIVYDA